MTTIREAISNAFALGCQMSFNFLNPPIVSDDLSLRSRADEAIGILSAADAAAQAGHDNRWRVWVDVHGKMASELNAEIMMGFQSHPAIAPYITGGSGKHFLTWIEREFGHACLDSYLKNYTETLCGLPKDILMERNTYITITSMRHLYHLARLKEHLKVCTTLPVTMVEIGGGFGNLCRLSFQYGLCDKYYIVDHPVLNAVQHFYLTEFMPSSAIAAAGSDGQFIKGNADCPVQLYSSFSYGALKGALTKPYVLCSTMALTEIHPPGQREYLDFFSPTYIYVFGQLENLAVAGGASSEDDYFSNKALIEEFADNYHTLHYGFYGYHFEYMGRKARLLW
ncbi:MAG: hypothetical protein L7F77_07520 [Candidatus Magnetominusculus sp. LBB02]|nr:hypothetical protein [Candidatus Magnetominusculus sp. LBB02]